MSAITDLCSMAHSAATAKVEIRRAVAAGDATRYHAVLRASPEVKLAEPLHMVRRSLSALAEERRGLPDNLAPAMRQVQEDQITAAMEQVAAGTLLWVNEALGLPAPEVATTDGGQGPGQSAMMPAREGGAV